jgi:hypothetical protein
MKNVTSNTSACYGSYLYFYHNFDSQNRQVMRIQKKKKKEENFYTTLNICFQFIDPSSFLAGTCVGEAHLCPNQ